MRDNLERVTIVLTKEQHHRFKEYARRYHGSVSQFIRLAGLNEMDDNNNTEDLRFRPITEKLEETVSMIQNIYRRLQTIERGTDFVVERLGSKMDKIANDVEELLLSSGRMFSIPEITGYLQYEQEEIISGIEKLEERFSITRIRQINSPSKWKIRGDIDDKR